MKGAGRGEARRWRAQDPRPAVLERILRVRMIDRMEARDINAH